MKGVIDRFTDNDQAVILIESIGKELVISRNKLPHGVKAQDWVILKEIDETYEVVRIDYETTKAQRHKAKQLQAKLRGLGKSSRFRKK